MVTRAKTTASPCIPGPSSNSWPAGPRRRRATIGGPAFLRNLAAGTDEQHPDSQGRITLSADHRRYANLSKDCVVIGAVDFLEIWDADAWRNYQQTHEETSPRPAMTRSAALSGPAVTNPRLPVQRGLCPNRPWRTSPTPGSRTRTGTSLQGR